MRKSVLAAMALAGTGMCRMACAQDAAGDTAAAAASALSAGDTA